MLRTISRQSQQGDRGFTLVEVLVSLVVFSLLMVATVAAMRTFGKTQVAVEEVTYRVEDIRMVSRFLRSSMEAIEPSVAGSVSGLSTGGGPSQDAASYFSGTASELIWSAPMLMGEVSGGMLTLRLSKEASLLVLGWLPVEGTQTDYKWQEASRKVLLEKVESLDVEYRERTGEAWVKSWEAVQGTPEAVKINFKVDGRYWPELIISL